MERYEERRQNLLTNLAKADDEASKKYLATQDYEKLDKAQRTRKATYNLLGMLRYGRVDPKWIAPDHKGTHGGGDYLPGWFYSGVAESIDNPAQISWGENSVAVYDDSTRRRSSLVKFLRKLPRIFEWVKVPDSDIDILASFVGPFLIEHEYKTKMVDGYDIVRVYNAEKFGSCMYQQDGPRLYAENDGKVEMIVLYEGDDWIEGLRARALVWHSDDGKTLLDRIYPDDGGVHVSVLNRHAKENGWMRRETNGPSSYIVWGPDDETLREPFRVTLKSVGHWPYMDTLYRVTDLGGGEIMVADEGVCDAYMRSTDDEAPFPVHTCDRCGDETGDEDDLTHVYGGDRVCNECLSEHYALIDNEYYDIEDDDVVVTVDHEYALEFDCTLVNNNYYPDGDDRIVQVGNTWYLASEVGVCDECGDDVPLEDLSLHGDMMLCDECYDEIEDDGYGQPALIPASPSVWAPNQQEV